MRTGNAQKLFVVVLAGLILAAILLAPTANALNFEYTDNLLSSLKVSSSPSVVKPGSVINVNVTGLLRNSNQSVVFLITFLVDTSSQSGKVLSSQYLFLSGNIFQNVVQTQIVVPNDALNNAYVYAVIGNGTIAFSKILIALVQNPTYLELQIQVNNLQQNATGLDEQITSLQNQLSSLNSTYNSLKADYDNLVNSSTSDKSSLLNQINTLQTKLNTLNESYTALQGQLYTVQSENSNLQTQLSEAQFDNDSLTSQFANLQDNNTALQNQVNTLLDQATILQNQVNNLHLNNTNLQSIVNTLNNQSISLQSQVEQLQSENNNTSILMYLATFVAIIFIIATIYIILIMPKRNGEKTEEDSIF